MSVPSTSAVHLDAATLTALVNGLLARQPDGPLRAIACVRVGQQVRLTLSGIRTGLSVFGMALPLIDADLLLSGAMESGQLVLHWELEAVRGVPAMAAKFLGKPALAKMLSDALRGRWGLDQALTVDAAGDLLLAPALLVIPGCAGLRIVELGVPAGDDYVVTATFTWS